MFDQSGIDLIWPLTMNFISIHLRSIGHKPIVFCLIYSLSYKVNYVLLIYLFIYFPWYEIEQQQVIYDTLLPCTHVNL